MPEGSTAVRTRFIWLGELRGHAQQALPRPRAYAVASGSKILASRLKQQRQNAIDDIKNDIVNDKSPKAELRGRARIPS